MTQDNTRDAWKSAAEAREYVRGERPAKPIPFDHAGEIQDQNARSLLSAIAMHYDPGTDPELPAQAKTTRLYQMIRRKEATETMTKAVHGGHEQTQSYFAGDPANKSDISGMKAIHELENMILSAAPIIYVFGEPGSGKTNISLLLAQLYEREYETAELASNIRTWEEKDRWIPSYPALSDWLDENTKRIDGGGITQKADANPKLFVFDEASSHATGRGKEGYETAMKMGPLVRKIRKANAGIIIIGHDGKDVHPAIRTLATHIERRRRELKRAWLWQDVIEREGRGKIAELAGVPETDYTYDDAEATSWRWSDNDQREEEDEKMTKAEAMDLAEDMAEKQAKRFGAMIADDDRYGISNKEVAAAIGQVIEGRDYRPAAVSNWKRRLLDD